MSLASQGEYLQNQLAQTEIHWPRFPIIKNQLGQLKGYYLLLTRHYHYQISFHQAKAWETIFEK